jgi:hypothetical protein
MTSSSGGTGPQVKSNNKASLDAVTSNEPLPNSQSNSLEASDMADTKSNPQLAKTSQGTSNDIESTSPSARPVSPRSTPASDKPAEKVQFKEPSDSEQLLDDSD